jgi:hypothetical protein
MVTVEILKPTDWTRGKGDVVKLSIGQTIGVPDAVANSMCAAGLAKLVPSTPIQTAPTFTPKTAETAAPKKEGRAAK